MDLRSLCPLPYRRLRRPRFTYRGAGTLLALLGGSLLLATWTAIIPPQRPPEPATPPPIKQPTSSPPPAQMPEPPPERTTAGGGCPEGCTSSKPGCAIKGNVSTSSKTKGERIYHVPGQRWYDETDISPEKGERWFCTEEEAVANGWRRAKV